MRCLCINGRKWNCTGEKIILLNNPPIVELWKGGFRVISSYNTSVHIHLFHYCIQETTYRSCLYRLDSDKLREQCSRAFQLGSLQTSIYYSIQTLTSVASRAIPKSATFTLSCVMDSGLYAFSTSLSVRGTGVGVVSRRFSGFRSR